MHSRPWRMLCGLFSDAYWCAAVELDPRLFGFGISRKRRYTVMLSKARFSGPAVPSWVLTTLMRTDGWCDPAHFFWETVTEPPRLSSRMISNLGLYRKKYGSRRAFEVHDLAQSAIARPRLANADGSLMTLTCGSRRVYGVTAGRCLTGRELLAAQSYPCCSWVATALSVSVPDVDALSNHQQVRIAGNGMHLACMTAALLCAFATGPVIEAAAPGIEPTATPARYLSPGCEPPRVVAALVGLCRTSASRVVEGLRLPTSGAERRELFPLPRPSRRLVAHALSSVDKVDVDWMCDYAATVVCALNFLEANCRPRGFGNRMSSASSPQYLALVHIVLRCARLVVRFTQMDDPLSDDDQVLASYEPGGTVKVPVLCADKIDLPPKASTCDALSNVGPALAERLSHPDEIVPPHRVGIDSIKIGKPDADEYREIMARMYSIGKIKLSARPSGVGSFFAVGKPGRDRQRPIWNGGDVSALSAPPPPLPRRLGNPASFVDIEAGSSRQLLFSKRDPSSFFDVLSAPTAWQRWFSYPPLRGRDWCPLLKLPWDEVVKLIDCTSEDDKQDEAYTMLTESYNPLPDTCREHQELDIPAEYLLADGVLLVELRGAGRHSRGSPEHRAG